MSTQPMPTRSAGTSSVLGASEPDTARAARPGRFVRRVWASSYRTAILATALAGLLAWGFLLLPPQNTDMAAQLARADFAREYPASIIDFRWFGGTVGFGYTLWAAAVMAVVGTKLTGAIAAVVGTWYATRLLQRLNPAHPLLGGMAAAVTQVGNVVEGRITFACGLTCGLIALTLFSTRRVPRWAAVSQAVVFSLLCGGASPVAALLLWVAGGTALVLRHYVAAATLIVPSALTALTISVVFGDGGRQPFSFVDCLLSALAMVIVLIATPVRCRPIRIGAAAGLAIIVIAFALPTPVGSNATRLGLLFALPVTAAFLQLRSRALSIALVAAVFALQFPVQPSTFASSGVASGYRGYYTPVVGAILSAGPLTGRVEVPDLEGHWDTVYVAHDVPLARGWLRQTDVRLNDAVFYKHEPTVDSYHAFLQANAVQYVAVPDAKATSFGEGEVDLVFGGLPYLDEIWHNEHWRLFRVNDAVALVDPPARVVHMSANAIVIAAPANAAVPVRLRWYPWLGLESRDKGSCIRADGLYVELRTSDGGNYTFNSRFQEGTGHCSPDLPR